MIVNYIYDLEKKTINRDIDEINVSACSNPFFYDGEEFHEYHSKFADEVIRLYVTIGGKVIAYCYLGVRDNELKAPYSSPFSLVYLKENFKIKDACLFVEALKDFARLSEYEKIIFTLPPTIYGEEIVNTLGSAFFSQGFNTKSIEINNYFDLTNYKGMDQYLKLSPHKVRKNYKRAIKNNLIFRELAIGDFYIAYDIIKKNRQQMGYPLKISRAQMQDLVNMNSSCVRTFVVGTADTLMAAAIVFDVTNDISQVVYWGDVIEHRNDRAMDLLTAKVFET